VKPIPASRPPPDSNRQEELKHEISTLEVLINITDVEITTDIVEKFCINLRSKLLDRESQFGKAYLNMLAEEIRVKGQEISIVGRNSVLIDAVQKTKAGDSSRAPTFDSRWLPILNSNYSDE
jgi:hypothetical protein